MRHQYTWIAALVGLSACVGESKVVPPTGASADAAAPTVEGDGGVPATGDAGEPEADAAVQPRPTCGYAGQQCCAAQAPCTAGATCVDSICNATEIWAVGSVTSAGDNGAQVVQPVVAQFNGAAWGDARRIDVENNESLLTVTPFPNGEYRATSDRGRVFALRDGTWAPCPLCTPTEHVGTPLSALFPVPGGYWAAGPDVLARCTQDGCSDVHEGLGALTSWGSIQLVGSSASDLWFGSAQTLFHFDGSRWTGTSAQPASVLWANADNDVWSAGVVGDSLTASIAHFDGTSWSTALPLPAFRVFSLTGSASDDIWVVGASTLQGAGSFCRRYDGTSWSDVPLAPMLRGIWSASRTQVLGFEGPTLYDYAGGAWASSVPTLQGGTGVIAWSALASKARLPAGR